MFHFRQERIGNDGSENGLSLRSSSQLSLYLLANLSRVQPMYRDLVWKHDRGEWECSQMR